MLSPYAPFGDITSEQTTQKRIFILSTYNKNATKRSDTIENNIKIWYNAFIFQSVVALGQKVMIGKYSIERSKP